MGGNSSETKRYSILLSIRTQHDSGLLYKIVNKIIHDAISINMGELGHLAAWHLPDGPVGPPARWAATSNVEGGSQTEEGALSKGVRVLLG